MERAAPAELKFWINGEAGRGGGTVQRTVEGPGETFTASETFDVGMDTMLAGRRRLLRQGAVRLRGHRLVPEAACRAP
jgi:hypothetical protein